MKKILFNFGVICITLCFLFICSSCSNKPKDLVSMDGMAPGYNGMIGVKVTMDGDKIYDVLVTNNMETPGIGSELKDENGKVINNGGFSPIEIIPKLIVENQSLNIDAVSGATATSYGVLHAVTDALVKLDYRVDAVSAATEKSNPNYVKPVVEMSDERLSLLNKWMNKVDYVTNENDVTSDVIVVGGGGAGLSAAISAAENGATVTIIEKNGEIGGNTLVCGAIYNAPDSELQNKVKMTDAVVTTIEKAIDETPVNDEHKELIETVKKQFDEYKESGSIGIFDSKEWFALQTYNGGDKIANLSLVKVLCFNAYDDLQWIKGMGVKFKNFISQGAGSLWQRTHTNSMPMGTGFISNYLKEIAKNKKINIVVNAEAVRLIQEDGRVVGVLCQDKYGIEFNAYANKGVILATGGFSSNIDMLNEYNTSGKWENLDIGTTNRETVSNGDGINMGIEVGADLVDMSEIQLLYLGNTKDSKLTKYPKRDVDSTDQVIFINKNGERFVNEGARRDDICKAVLNEPDKMFYILESGDGANYVDIYSSDYKSADGFSLQYLIDNDYVCIGDTLEELCEKIDIDVDTLKKTIEDFNECVDGKPDKYGRTLYSTKLLFGPYVATKRKVAVHHTMGGLKIDEEARVLNVDGMPINGLYAAGEVTGGIHGSNRLGGNAVVDTVVFGRTAGSSVARHR